MSSLDKTKITSPDPFDLGMPAVALQTDGVCISQQLTAEFSRIEDEVVVERKRQQQEELSRQMELKRLRDLAKYD